MDTRDEHEPLLRVVRGHPHPEEVAALVAALAARAPAEGDGPAPPPSAWSDRAAALRRPLHPGPGAWRDTARQPGVRLRVGP